MLLFKVHTFMFQLEDMVRLFGTLFLLDAIDFPKSEPCLIIGSVLSNWSTFRHKSVCINLHLYHLVSEKIVEVIITQVTYNVES